MEKGKPWNAEAGCNESASSVGAHHSSSVGDQGAPVLMSETPKIDPIDDAESRLIADFILALTPDRSQLRLPQAMQAIERYRQEILSAGEAREGAGSPERIAGWQPIETAPKDGTRILVCWGPDSDSEVVFWRADREQWCQGTGGWGSDRWPDQPNEDAPTHWHALPDCPPKAATVLDPPHPFSAWPDRTSEDISGNHE